MKGLTRSYRPKAILMHQISSSQFCRLTQYPNSLTADRQEITAILCFDSHVHLHERVKKTYRNKCNFSKMTKYFFVKLSAIISKVCRKSIKLR